LSETPEEKAFREKLEYWRNSGKGPAINGGYCYDYTSPIDGSKVTNRKQHLEHCKRHNVVAVGNEYSKEKE